MEAIKEKKISKKKPHMILEPHSYLLVNGCLWPRDKGVTELVFELPLDALKIINLMCSSTVNTFFFTIDSRRNTELDSLEQTKNLVS